ncbi:ATP-binding protein [Streptomyces sp. NPDC048590]|uniref:ATP-binding protein n=1 Tax=Streptomyces sp. NPDC048590 TaxID=3365574 RepID=UPI00371BBEEB
MTNPAPSAAPRTRVVGQSESFTQRFSSTPRGARLARRLTVLQIERWGMAPGSEVSDRAALVVAELAANAVTHGRVPGRDFELNLTWLHGSSLRIEVSDTRGERSLPAPGRLGRPYPDAECGRGLLLVEAMADRWSVQERLPAGKTVRAELDLRRPVRAPRLTVGKSLDLRELREDTRPS